MLVNSKVMTITGDSLYAIVTNKGPVLEIERNHHNEKLYNLEMVAVLEKDSKRNEGLPSPWLKAVL